MKPVKVDEKIIHGIGIRTTNAREMNPETARIGALYQAFDKKVPVDYKNGARVYGVYSAYETDYSGEFSVMAGTDMVTESLAEQLEQVTLLSGDYLVFAAKGAMPQVVIDTWAIIWDYFSNGEAAYERAYSTDFEFYKSQEEIEIYIAIK